MSKRHWLRDVIDFSGSPHGTWSVGENCYDNCNFCNDACRGIAESLALYGLDDSSCKVLGESEDGLYDKRLNRLAKYECAFPVFESDYDL